MTFLWEEGGVHFAFSPAMDITGYGHSEEEAKSSFEVTLSETIAYMQNKGCMYQELRRLGWNVNEKKRKVQSPDLESLKSDNEEFARISGLPGIKMSNSPLELQLS